MLLQFPNNLGGVFVGPCVMRDLDFEVSVHLWPRRYRQTGERRFRINLAIIGDWPHWIFRRISPPATVWRSSAAWTGRECRIIGIKRGYLDVDWSFLPHGTAIDWTCHVCGKPIVIAPDLPERGICFACCGMSEDGHDFEYDRSERAHACLHCGAPPPLDFYDVDPESERERPAPFGVLA